MHNGDGQMPSTLTYGHMPYDVPMKPETHAQPKHMTCHPSTDSVNQQQNQLTDINTTLDALSMYYRKAYKTETNRENGMTEQG